MNKDDRQRLKKLTISWPTQGNKTSLKPLYESVTNLFTEKFSKYKNHMKKLYRVSTNFTYEEIREEDKEYVLRYEDRRERMLRAKWLNVNWSG